MIIVTITVGAILTLSVLGYFVNHYREEARNSQAKYLATKQFADNAAARILRLESDNKAMASHINTLVSEKSEAPIATKPVEATTQNAKPKRRFYNKKKNSNKPKDKSTN